MKCQKCNSENVVTLDRPSIDAEFLCRSGYLTIHKCLDCLHEVDHSITGDVSICGIHTYQDKPRDQIVRRELEEEVAWMLDDKMHMELTSREYDVGFWHSVSEGSLGDHQQLLCNIYAAGIRMGIKKASE